MRVRDINSQGRNFWLIDDQNDSVHVRDLPRSQGILGLLKREDVVRFAFFTPDSVWPLLGIY